MLPCHALACHVSVPRLVFGLALRLPCPWVASIPPLAPAYFVFASATYTSGSSCFPWCLGSFPHHYLVPVFRFSCTCFLLGSLSAPSATPFGSFACSLGLSLAWHVCPFGAFVATVHRAFCPQERLWVCSPFATRSPFLLCGSPPPYSWLSAGR